MPRGPRGWHGGEAMNDDDRNGCPDGCGNDCCMPPLDEDHGTQDRCSTRCDHDSQCTLSEGHGDRHETEHGCICYDPRNEGELRFAPHGASEAECAVCCWKTMKRVTESDGHVPICSSFCLQAWPRVRDLLARVAAYEEVLTTRREHEQRADDRLNDALSGEADAVRRAESAELGCEIAYRREPTQAEGDAHADGADECFVTMGGWTGRRCRACGRWVWGGPTACEGCVRREDRAKKERL